MFPLNFIKGLFGQTQKSANPAIFGFFAPSAMPKMGEKEYLKAYKGWVFACVNAIAQRISEIEVNLEKKTKDSWQAVDTHPALDILHNVKDFMSYGDLMFGTQAFQELTGNHFWYLTRNKGGTISEIWPLDPTRVQVVAYRTLQTTLSSSSMTRAIYRLMEDDDRRVRFAAWHTLEDGGLPSEPDALARLELLLNQEIDPKVRVFAKRLIGAALAERDRHEFARMQLASRPASRMRGKCDFCSARDVAVERDLDTMIPTDTLPRPALICQRCAGAA